MGAPSRKEPKITKSNKEITPLYETFRAIPKRGLTKESIEKYGIGVNMDKSRDIAHVYPYFKDGHHVANKIRTREVKDFYTEGDIRNAELFGQHLFPPGSAKAITIVEGELDAASAYQLRPDAGGVAERLNAPDYESGEVQGSSLPSTGPQTSVGSNPTASAPTSESDIFSRFGVRSTHQPNPTVQG